MVTLHTHPILTHILFCGTSAVYETLALKTSLVCSSLIFMDIKWINFVKIFRIYIFSLATYGYGWSKRNEREHFRERIASHRDIVILGWILLQSWRELLRTMDSGEAKTDDCNTSLWTTYHDDLLKYLARFLLYVQTKCKIYPVSVW